MSWFPLQSFFVVGGVEAWNALKLEVSPVVGILGQVVFGAAFLKILSWVQGSSISAMSIFKTSAIAMIPIVILNYFGAFDKIVEKLPKSIPRMPSVFILQVGSSAAVLGMTSAMS